MAIISYDFKIHRRLFDPDPDIRCDAIKEIADCGTAPNKNMLPKLVCLLQDPSGCVRIEALRALAKFYKKLDSSVRQNVISLIRDEDETVRDALIESLMFFSAGDCVEDDSIEYLVRCLRDGNCQIRRDAVRALTYYTERLSPDSLCEVISMFESDEIRGPAREFLSEACAQITPGTALELAERIRCSTSKMRHLVGEFLLEAGHHDLLY